MRELMREIKDHVVEGDSINTYLHVETGDKPGAGGASHHYLIWNEEITPLHIDFQNGSPRVPGVGVNGVTHEALLAILIDRLRGFQRGPFACDENAVALINLENALSMLQSRTKARILRGVEGTNQQ
jgi:hypothetical protein